MAVVERWRRGSPQLVLLRDVMLRTDVFQGRIEPELRDRLARLRDERCEVRRAWWAEMDWKRRSRVDHPGRADDGEQQPPGAAMPRRRNAPCQTAGRARCGPAADTGSCGCAGRCRRRRAVLGWSGSADRWRRDESRRGLRPWSTRRGEVGLCGGHVATVLGLCLAPGPDRRLAGVGGFRGERGRGRPRAVRPLSEAPPGCVVKRGGRVGQENRPPGGAAEVRGVLAPAA